MSTGSSIEWTDATWNPVVGCTRASAGCDHCYAVAMTHRLEGMGQSKYAGLTVLNPRGERHFNGVVRTDEAALGIPLRWKKPRRVFVNSMSDLFHKDVPFEFVAKVFTTMAQTPQHTYQILTKRPGRMRDFYNWNYPPEAMSREEAAADFRGSWPNVWLGTSVESQGVDWRIAELLQIPAVVRFVSLEPLIGAVSLRVVAHARSNRGFMDALTGETEHEGVRGRPHAAPPMRPLDWVIVGGESGHRNRPCHVEWIRLVVDQCKGAGVPVFVKQLGGCVRVRNDRVAEWEEQINREGGAMCLEDYDVSGVRMQGDPIGVRLADPKGGDMGEWPEPLRVREMPGGKNVAGGVR